MMKNLKRWMMGLSSEKKIYQKTEYVEKGVPQLMPIDDAKEMSPSAFSVCSSTYVSDLLLTFPPTDLLEVVIATLHAPLPEVVEKSIDTIKERQLIEKKLQPLIQQYLLHISEQVCVDMNSDAQVKVSELKRQLDDTTSLLRKCEIDRDNYQKMQLSAERQRRTLSDKLHDLEKKTATIEEQYDTLERLKQKEAEHQALQKRFEQEFAELRTQLDNEISKSQQMQDKLEQGQKAIDELAAKSTYFAASEASVIKANEQVVALQESLDKLDAEQKNEIKRLNRELLVANDMLNAFKTQRQTLMSDVQREQQEKIELREINAKIHSEIQQQVDLIDNLNKQINRQTKEIERYKERKSKRSSRVFDNETDENWLNYTTPDTPEIIAQRNAEKQALLEAEQQKMTKPEVQPDNSKQMSLW